VILAKEETVLQSMINRVTGTDRLFGVKMNVEENKVMRITRQPSSVQIMIGQKQLETVEYLKYLGSLITNDARCTLEIKARMSWQNQQSTRRSSFQQQIRLTFRKKLVQSYIWNIAWYDAENWTLRKVDH
jgi:hypothetical protein